MDNNHPDFKANETTQKNASDLDKLTQSYLLLRKRISGTHELIKQYNDKLKECERLKQDLDGSNKQMKKMTCNYNSTLAKVIKLELQNTEYKKNIETLTTRINDHNIKAAADQQHIQQLICKIKDVEGSESDKIMQYDLEKSSLQVKVKELEQELKNVKKAYETKMKKIEKKLPTENENKPKLKDAETNTTLTKDIIVQKPEVTEKCVLTDEFYKVKDDVYPIFCGKCEILLEPPPLEKICKIMTESCPKLIEKISSPPKKPPSPLLVSTDINSEQCKTESLPILADSPLPHLQNQNNHADFIPTNLLPSHRIPLNRTNYCNTFSPTSNLMTQGNYYIESTPINPLTIANSSTANQSNHCESMATIASSLSIISSLQKRIDTLETKVKKKLNKRKSEQNSGCCQHCHPNTCSMYNMNNPMQFDFLELWKRMADFYEKREKKNIDVRKKSRKHKLSQVKRKRLQNINTGSWKVESIAKMVEQGPLRKRPKKRKYQYSALFDKSDGSLNNSAELNSDSDADSSVDTFNDSGDSKANITLESKSIPYVEASTSTSKSNNTDANEIEAVETVSNSAEYNKLVGGETDSGILSDSEHMDICSELTQQENVTEIKSSVQSKSCSIETDESAKSKLVDKSPIKVASHLMKSNEPIKQKNVNDRLYECMNYMNLPEASQSSNLMTTIKTNNLNAQSCMRKRKINEPQELKKAENRKELLNKLKNLKKNSKVVKTCKNVSEHHDVQSYEHECSNISEERKDVEREVIREKDYTPRKKPRIAHVPKGAVTEPMKSLNNSLQFKKQLAYNVENMSAQNTKINCSDSSKSKEDNSELQKVSDNKVEEPRLIISNTVNSNAPTAVEDTVQEIPSPDSKNSLSDLESKNSLDTDVNNCDQSNIESNANCSSSETIELNEIKTESNNQPENLEHEHGNNSLGTQKTAEIGIIGEQELLNDVNETNLNVEEVTNSININERHAKIEYGSTPHCLLTKLQQYIYKNKYSKRNCMNPNKKLLEIGLITDKFVKKQLQRLMDNEWQTSVHWDVIETLKKSSCSARIIAKGIVDFLSTDQMCSRKLDKSFTPPAPIMSSVQQRIAALLVDLEESKPTVFQFVQAGIEYKLFRLNQQTERTVIESLARMYTVLARIKKDREKVRIFCCDALYCLGLNSVIILYTVLTCWPEVFPNNETNTELLPKCMAHIIMTQQAVDFPKLNPLKNLLSIFYKYPMGVISKDLLIELLTVLQEKCHCEVETAIILLAKKEGTTWTYKNIVKSALLPMIINDKIPNTYRAFCLLGNLMRVFPVEDKDNSVGEIVDQLSDLINSGEGSDEQKEGVISALLSFSRHKFNEVMGNAIKWIPSMSLHDRTIEQINGVFNSRNTDFWLGYLRKHRKLLCTQKKSKT